MRHVACMPTSAISLRTSIASVVPVTVALCETADYTSQLLLLLLLLLPLDCTCWHTAFRQNLTATGTLSLPFWSCPILSAPVCCLHSQEAHTLAGMSDYDRSAVRNSCESRHCRASCEQHKYTFCSADVGTNNTPSPAAHLRALCQVL